MFLSQKELAKQAGLSVTTFWRRLKLIKFKKKSPGKFYDEKESEYIAKKLNFTIIFMQKADVI